LSQKKKSKIKPNSKLKSKPKIKLKAAVAAKKKVNNNPIKRRLRRTITCDTVDFNYKTIKKSNNIVILGAGPSLSSNIDNIKQYIVRNKSIVIGSNYNFVDLGLNANYTYITDEEKLLTNISKINCPVIIASAILNQRTYRSLRAFRSRTRLPVYKIGRHGAPHVYEEDGLINIDPEGCFRYRSLGIAGLGALVSSIIFKPQRVLVVGIDDPTPGKDHKIMYDGTKVRYTKNKKCQKVIRYFSNRIVPTFRHKKIIIDTFSDVNFFGLSKRKMKFNVIG